LSQFFETLIAVGGVSALFVAAVAIESRSVGDRRTLWQAAGFNLAYYATALALVWPIQAVAAPALVALVNSAGGGLIRLSSTGWYFATSVLAVLVVTDLLEYGYHRTQHTVPFLWRLHSFHHSEERLNATTAARQHWVDALVRSLIIFPVVGVIFRADPAVILVARLLTMLNNAQAHMGTRRDGGKLWWLLNSPQYHRCHHSFAAHCVGRNLASMFPLWDILFGTCYKPAPDEYGPTGLQPSVRPSLGGAMLWPLGASTRLL
jgi:sterol desaturase/sphingolipid hydroxylase (fatty acid hydroxylase superfamily)